MTTFHHFLQGQRNSFAFTVRNLDALEAITAEQGTPDPADPAAEAEATPAPGTPSEEVRYAAFGMQFISQAQS